MKQIVQELLIERNLSCRFIADSMHVIPNTVTNRRQKHIEAMTNAEYKENFLALKANLAKGVYGGDPHPNTSRCSINSSVKVPIDRKSTPNAGGFSDPQ